ncbi:hypothetical protein BX666DRAFT_1875076 [Dichotomocladium elegans]|nr:hypothetical protein BX666DRAFT_1875076 [Dichotomocladium elegans]
MGQLLSSLSLRCSEGSNTAMLPEINLDLEHATPSSAEEQKIYAQLADSLVQPGPGLLTLLKNYTSASAEVRQAIASPTAENEDAAWQKVLPIVDMLEKIHTYAMAMREGVPQLLQILCQQADVARNLEKHPALAKLFADMLDFVFEFDYLKRGRYATCDNATSELRSAMDQVDQANRISLFIANPTPMLKTLIDTTTEFVTQHRLQKSVGECLATLWAACFQTASRRRQEAFCLKVMVVSIILYDHIDPSGVFSKNSPINIKNSVKMIQTATTMIPDESSTSNLLSALRYNSKHLNDDTTPKGVKNLVLAA